MDRRAAGSASTTRTVRAMCSDGWSSRGWSRLSAEVSAAVRSGDVSSRRSRANRSFARPKVRSFDPLLTTIWTPYWPNQCWRSFTHQSSCPPADHVADSTWIGGSTCGSARTAPCLEPPWRRAKSPRPRRNHSAWPARQRDARVPVSTRPRRAARRPCPAGLWRPSEEEKLSAQPSQV
jgi:hypothetical protein